MSFPKRKKLFTDSVSVNKKYLTDTLSVKKKYLTDSGVPLEKKHVKGEGLLSGGRGGGAHALTAPIEETSMIASSHASSQNQLVLNQYYI